MRGSISSWRSQGEGVRGRYRPTHAWRGRRRAACRLLQHRLRVILATVRRLPHMEYEQRAVHWPKVLVWVLCLAANMAVWAVGVVVVQRLFTA
jgi:hypothetical protein